MVLVLSRGMTQGAKAGMATAGGVSVGLLGHTMLAALGLGALLLSSDLLFTIFKYIGAVYLTYLGFRLILTRVSRLEIAGSSEKPLKRLFVEGALSNISNPKITIFYFAFLPQFLSVDVKDPASYLIGLGIGFALLTFLVKAPIGFFAGIASKWVQNRPLVLKAINRVSGIVLIGLGAKLAFEQK